MINKTLFVEQIKRYWAIPALATLVYLLGVYAPIIDIGALGRTYWLTEFIFMRHEIVLYNIVLTPIVTAFCIFGFFFNKRAATFFYSFPLNKKQIFFTNALAGIVLSLLPVIIFCALLLLLIPQEFQIYSSELHYIEEVQKLYPNSVDIPHVDDEQRHWHNSVIVDITINIFPIIASLFLRMAITTIFYFAMAWLAFSMAGHRFTALLIAGIIPFIPFLLFQAVDIIGYLLVFGYVPMGGMFVYRFLIYFNPAMWLHFLYYSDSYTQVVVIPAVVYTVIATIFFSCAYFISRARKPERTGDSVMFTSIKNLFIFVVSIAPMIVMIFLAPHYELLYLLFPLGFVVGYIAAQMIVEKTFLIADKIKYFPHFFGVTAALCIFILMFTQFGMFFYVNRVPAEDKISAVYVTNRGFQFSRIAFNDAPEFIAAAQQAHQTILNGRRTVKKFLGINGTSVFYSYYLDYSHAMHSHEIVGFGFPRKTEPFYIEYLMKNGRTARRVYFLPHTFITDTGLNTFLDSKEVVLGDYDAFKYPEYLESIELMFAFPEWDERGHWRLHFDYPEEEAVLITDKARMETFLEIIEKGAVENAEFLRTNPQTNLSFWQSVYPKNEKPDPRVNIYFAYNNEIPTNRRGGSLIIFGEHVHRLLEQLD